MPLFIVIICVFVAVLAFVREEYLWSTWFSVLGTIAVLLQALSPENSYRLVTCTNSEDVVIKSMTGRVTTYKGSNYVSNDTETYIIPPGATCSETEVSSPSSQ